MNHQHVIGADNKLPWHIPEDLAYFKQLTLNKPIIMGRKTFESIGRPLPRRRNIVISRSGFIQDDVEVFCSLEEALLCYKNEPEICIIGGGELFKLALNYINSLHLTIVNYPVTNPCAWFPKLDLSIWSLVESKCLTSISRVECQFRHYILPQIGSYTL